MNRLTLAERIVIECGIYQKLKLSQIAKKIGKTPECFKRNPTQQDVCFGRASVRKRLLFCRRM